MKTRTKIALALAVTWSNSISASAAPSDDQRTLKSQASENCAVLGESEIYDCILLYKYQKYDLIRTDENIQKIPSIVAELRKICARSSDNEFLLMECIAGIAFTGRSPGFKSVRNFLEKSPNCEEFHHNYIRLWDNFPDHEKVRLPPDQTFCDTVERLSALWNVVLEKPNSAAITRREEIGAEARALEMLRQNASDGSPAARFLLASRLLEIEKFSDTYRPATNMEAIEILALLAKEGHKDAVYSLVTGYERQYPEPASENVRLDTFLYIYGALATSGDPRGYIKLAEEYLRRARFTMDQGNRAGAISEIQVAKSYLQEGYQFATGGLATHISNLQSEVGRLENSPTEIHIILSAFIAGAAFVENWKQEGFEAAVDQTEDCVKNKPAVDLDPNLRLIYSFYGCIPY